MASAQSRIIWRIVIIAICAIGGLMLASQIPKIYVRSATLQDKELPASPETVVRSDAVLKPVVEKMDLPKKWADDPLAKLRKRVDAIPIRNTELLAVQVRSTDPAEAADLANEIAGSYMEVRFRAWQSSKMRAIEQLKTETEELRRRANEKRAAMERLGTDLIDNKPDTAEPPASTFPTDYIAAKNDYIQSRQVSDAAEAKLQQATAEVAMVDNNPFILWEKADASVGGQKPNTFFATVLGGLIAGMVGAIAAFIIIRPRW